VAKTAIGRLLRRREPLPPDVAAALERLDQLAEASPSLHEAAALQGAILRTIHAAPTEVGTVALTQELAAEKLRDGLPLLRGERLPLNVPAIEATILRLCKTVRELESAPGSVDEIAAAIKGQALQVETLVQAVMDGRLPTIHERAAELGVDGEMLCTLLRFSLFPALLQFAAQLAALQAVAPWQRGYCPICGSWPLLGEHRGLEQMRFLRCGLCAAEWAVDRLLCPYCGCRNHEYLGYLHVEDEEQKRAVTCEQCHGYVKVIATLMSIPPIELAVHDLATIHLDMVAIERGYIAPT
jgi:FdhE protein